MEHACELPSIEDERISEGVVRSCPCCGRAWVCVHGWAQSWWSPA